VPDPDIATDFEVVDDPPAPPEIKQDSYSFAPKRTVPDEAPPPLPKKKRRRRRLDDRGSGGSGFPISISPGVIGGFLCMVIAVVWFIAGLYFGWVFFYPPILFIIGLVRFVASLMGQEED